MSNQPTVTARRAFLQQTGLSLGSIALASMLSDSAKVRADEAGLLSDRVCPILRRAPRT